MSVAAATMASTVSAGQNLVLFGRLTRMTRRDAQRRADELLGQFGLSDAAEKQVKHYSGGMRRRLDLAVTLLLRPEVLFLDEPTTGLDPRNRTEVWDAVRSLAADGTTVLLTTQYLDEADQLAGRVAVMEAGRVIAEGTPDELKREVGGDQLEVIVEESPHDLSDLDRTREAVSRYSAGPPHVDPAQRRVSAPVDDRVAAMAGVLRDLQEYRVAIEDIALRKPTLDDVFLRLTGHAAENGTHPHPGETGTR
jgi:ABC-2 type transport system ATP-binding protein